MKSSIENKMSSLITREENEQVFRMFGIKCQSLSTAIVQLFMSQGPEHVHWIKKESGIMCFVKDHIRRNYFFRMYCLNRSKLVWEQELYNNFEYKSPSTYFHMFEIDDCIAGINFASEDEALIMKHIVNEKLALKRQRREERRSRSSLQNKTTLQSNQEDVNKPTYNINTNSSNDKYNFSSLHQQSGKNKKKTKLTKDDIGLPENFIHISHVGWDPNKGFDVNVEDDVLKEFFNKAGVNKYLKNKKARDFIYDFINKNGGMYGVQNDLLIEHQLSTPPPVYTSNRTQNNQVSATPPPVPARTTLNRTAPPPPPPSKGKPAPPPQVRGQPPPRPDPIQSIPELPSTNNAPTPPPPPPPILANDICVPPPPPPINNIMPSNLNTSAASSADPRSALLESIRAGKALKPVDKERKVSVGDSRGDLLHEIRQGIELKPVQISQRPSSGPSSQENSLAEALSNALKARAFAIHSDSESDSGNITDDDDEWEQDD